MFSGNSTFISSHISKSQITHSTLAVPFAPVTEMKKEYFTLSYKFTGRPSFLPLPCPVTKRERVCVGVEMDGGGGEKKGGGSLWEQCLKRMT